MTSLAFLWINATLQDFVTQPLAYAPIQSVQMELLAATPTSVLKLITVFLETALEPIAQSVLLQMFATQPLAIHQLETAFRHLSLESLAMTEFLAPLLTYVSMAFVLEV